MHRTEFPETNRINTTDPWAAAYLICLGGHVEGITTWDGRSFYDVKANADAERLCMDFWNGWANVDPAVYAMAYINLIAQAAEVQPPANSKRSDHAMPFPMPKVHYQNVAGVPDSRPSSALSLPKAAGRHGHVYAVTDHQLANYLINQGVARVIRVDVAAMLPMIYLEADVELTPFIARYQQSA